MALMSLKQKFKICLFNKERRIYAVLNGQYKGEWLVVVKKTVEQITFFSLPDKFIRIIPLKDFEWGLKNKVLEVVDVLPKGVYNVCLAEYNLKATDDNTTNSSNRRKQHSTPDILDSK